MSGVSRRRFLGTAGAAAVGGLAAGAGGAAAVTSGDGRDAVDPSEHLVPFRGPIQAGITTEAPDRVCFAAFDVNDGVTREQLAAMLLTWTDAAERMTQGRSVGEPRTDLAPPDDTGEADGLTAASLTVTFGFGPGLFERKEFGLAGQKPKALAQLRDLPGDTLDATKSYGHLCVQACANDPVVAFHAVRNLARLGRGTVVMRWTQLGFGRTSRTTSDQGTPRNLMGFRDGTNNITSDDAKGLEEFVWAGSEAPAWMRGGTYAVTRRIRMLIEVWDRASLADQQLTIGRMKQTGAPLGAGREKDAVDLAATQADGQPLIPADAHIRLAAPSVNGGVRILRRGYSFTDGVDPQLGQLDAGLFFIAFMRDPEQFARLQERLGTRDKLNEYIRHDSSAVFAIPPGTTSGQSIAHALLA